MVYNILIVIVKSIVKNSDLDIINIRADNVQVSIISIWEIKDVNIDVGG